MKGESFPTPGPLTLIPDYSICAAAGLMVLLFVNERFERPRGQERFGLHLIFASFTDVVRSRATVSVLLVLILVQVGPTMMMPVLPVFIGTLSAVGRAASNAGVAFSIMGFMGAVSSVVVGRLTQRVSPFFTTSVDTRCCESALSTRPAARSASTSDRKCNGP